MKERVTVWIGIFAMLLLVLGVFLPAGSLVQKILFLIGAPTLWWVAVVERRNIFIALQLVVTLGAILAFVPQIPDLFRYLIMLSAVGMAVTWLREKESSWGAKEVLGVFGLSLIAVGLATPVVLYPMPFFAFLGIGGLLVAITAGMSIAKGFRLGWIWLLLNLLFAWNPIVQLFGVIR